MAGLPQINRFQTGLVTQRNPLNSPYSIVGMNVVTHYDALIDGLNVEVSNFNTLIRRFGFTAFSANSVTEQPDNIDIFLNLNGTYRTMLDTSGHLYWINAGTYTPIITKTTTNVGRFATVGNWLYYGDGADPLKWNGTNLWKWGIAAPTIAPTLTFTALPSDTYITTQQFDPTTELFTGTLSISTNGGTASVYTFNNDSLTSMAVKLNAGTGSPAPSPTPQVTASLVQVVFLPHTSARLLQIASVAPGLSGTLTILSTVSDVTDTTKAFTLLHGTYTGSLIAAVIAPQVSYSWVYVYKNSVTGHISTASPPVTLITQKIPGSAVLSGPGSTDPQVDQIEVYRTQDGGSSYFLEGTTPNTLPTWTFQDNFLDAPLGTALFLNTLVIAPLAFANEPPQIGATDPVFHTGRLWYHVGGTLYYSGGAEVTNGVAVECSPPANYFALPGSIQKKISTANGLLVFLTDDVYLITGLDISSYYAQLFARNLGIGNPDGVVYDGQTLYVYNSKRQLYSLTTSKTTEIGFAVGDVLRNNFNPATTHMTLHRGDSTDYALYVSNGTDRYMRYYPDGNSWSPAAIPAMSCGVVKSVTTAPGTTQMMLLPNTPTASVYQVFYRNTSLNSDKLVPFTASATVGSLVLAQAGQKPAIVEQVGTNARRVGSLFGLSLRTDNVAGSFEPILFAVDDPPNATPSTTLYTSRWYLKQTNNPVNQTISNIQLKFDWIAEDAPNELYGFYLWNSKQ